MKGTLGAISLPLVALVVLAWVPRGDASTAWVQQREVVVARVGDVAAGTIALLNEKELRLDTSPCDAKAVVVVFYPPYVKTKIGTVTCGTRVIDRYQAEKK